MPCPGGLLRTDGVDPLVPRGAARIVRKIVPRTFAWSLELSLRCASDHAVDVEVATVQVAQG